ncbi:MarR family winged helix-turn-helix transcriptional regulator [Desulfosporosinus fructosivorans]
MNEKDEENYDLTEQFTRIEWLLHRYHQQNHTHYGPMGDPRKGQGRVLAVLKLQPEISQKDLLYLLDMRPQSLGELLSKLEKNGYITRTLSETDRRVMNIKLTKEGTEATEQEFSFDKLFECLNEEEQMNLSIYLNRIIETIEAQLGDEQSGPDFDPRQRVVNPFYDRFGGHTGPRGFHGRDFDHRGGMQDGYSRNGQFDPRSEMGHRPGMTRPGMNRGHGEGPAPSQKKLDEE